ncbi:MAG: hypothetical protein JWM47_3395 [Acidimicrobiales bacterium]|nr:hypothetical protein [Acidimicrobiales bacterium]
MGEMTDHTIVEPRPAGSPGGAATGPGVPTLAWTLAGLSAAAGVIHFAMVPGHGEAGVLEPLGFAAFGWAQLLVAGAILADRAGKRMYQFAVLVNLAAIGLWLWSRTVGLPLGAHANEVESINAVDASCVGLEVGAVLLAARLLLAPAQRSVGRLAPALVAVAALGLATTAITSSDAISHGHTEAAAVVDSHTALMDKIDATRCDTDLNPASYWEEATYLGVDTRQGGAMSPAHTDAAAPAADHHGGATAAPGATTTTTEPDPTGGRGSAVLDHLVADTSQATGAETAAARLVSDLSDADQEDYDAWLWWLRSRGAAGHSDTGGHGGHVGPQPWTALTKAPECRQLDKELAQARAVAAKYPTAADAVAGGYRRVTPYVQGIAAHYMKFRVVDDTFDIDEPEMLLYDGNDPDAHIAGLSYYLLQDGTDEPTQGFTGANDHFHRHVGLCQGKGGVIGDSSLTAEECEARGGRKADGSNGWMSHAWVVPGCESPWGVFSPANPILDTPLAKASGDNDGGCSASNVRDRYGLDGGTEAVSASKAAGDEDQTAARAED